MGDVYDLALTHPDVRLVLVKVDTTDPAEILASA
jgi:hypothetical protein